MTQPWKAPRCPDEFSRPYPALPLRPPGGHSFLDRTLSDITKNRDVVPLGAPTIETEAGRADVFCQPRQPRDSARGTRKQSYKPEGEVWKSLTKAKGLNGFSEQSTACPLHDESFAADSLTWHSSESAVTQCRDRKALCIEECFLIIPPVSLGSRGPSATCPGLDAHKLQRGAKVLIPGRGISRAWDPNRLEGTPSGPR